MNDPIIAARGVSIVFDEGGNRTQALRNLNLEIKRGEFLAIVGPSGVGKSTLLRIFMGLVSPSSGTIDVRPDPDAERPMALVFQEPRLLPWRSAADNVAFGLEKAKLSRTERRARAHAALALVGLGSFGDRWPRQLSGGQRQRIALARALAVRPSILLMDEPFSALDVATRETLQDELVRIWMQTGKTIVFVTHDIDEAVYLADRVVALGGKPGEARAIHVVDAARPRRRNAIALQEIALAIKAALSAEALQARDDWVI